MSTRFLFFPHSNKGAPKPAPAVQPNPFETRFDKSELPNPSIPVKLIVGKRIAWATPI